MGNSGCQECTDGKERTFSKTLGHIVYDPNIQIGDPGVPTYYEIEEEKKLNKIKNISERWSKINSLNTNLIIKPLRIDKYEEKGSFFFKTYTIKIYFNAYKMSLSRFSEENLKINPILPEILLLNILSNTLHALSWLKRYNLPHFNFSPETIFLDHLGGWIITPPNRNKINLFERKEEGELVQFLIPPELKTEKDFENFDWVKCDIFSLGITILHCIYPFHRYYMDKVLSKEEINKKMTFFRSYYSKSLIFLLEKMVELDYNKRRDLEFIIKSLKDIQKNKLKINL